MKTLHIRKLCIVFTLLMCLVGCQKQEEAIQSEPERAPEEYYLDMINECITDYNDDVIAEREVEWNRTISPKPLEIDSINNISSLKDIQEYQPNDEITNAKYAAKYDLGDYYMDIRIYNPSKFFWLFGDVKFEVKDTNQIIVNNEAFSSYKATLDDLLARSREYVPYIYGIGVNKGAESTSVPGFYQVIDIGGHPIHTIQEFKDMLEGVFTTDMLQEYYASAFDKNDGIYKDIDGRLYCSDSEITVHEGLMYDTSRIIAVRETDDEILIDLVVSLVYPEDESLSIVDPQVQRIVIVKTENGPRLNNVY